MIYRGTDYHVAYNHSYPVEKEQFLQDIESYMSNKGYEKIFLATEVEEMVTAAKDYFKGNMICYPQLRFHEDERRFLYEIDDVRENGTFLRGKEYLIILRTPN